MSDISHSEALEKTASLVSILEDIGCDIKGDMPDVSLHSEDVIEVEIDLFIPINETFELEKLGEDIEIEEEETTEKAKDSWCGRCGEGPLTEGGVSVHHHNKIDEKHHDGLDPVVLDHKPDEEELVGGSEVNKTEEKEDKADGEECSDEDEKVEELTEEEIKDKRERFREKGLPEHAPRDLEPPNDMHADDIEELVSDIQYIEDVAESLGWKVDRTDRLLKTLGLDGDVEERPKLVEGEEEDKSEEGDEPVPDWSRVKNE